MHTRDVLGHPYFVLSRVDVDFARKNEKELMRIGGVLRGKYP